MIPTMLPVNNVRTVSDTKRSFYTLHTRPINSIYRRVVDELMVEMHLLSVNQDFHYDSVYALGVVSSFDRFMQGYRPEADRDSIFNALCRSLQGDPHRYRHDAEQLEAFALRLPSVELVAQLSHPETITTADELKGQLERILTGPFKYSRLFAIGLYTLLEASDLDLAKDEQRRTETLKQVGAALHISEEKFLKDIDLYRSNLEKMAQARLLMDDLLQAERKKREKRAADKENPPIPAGDSLESDPPKDEAASS